MNILGKYFSITNDNIQHRIVINFFGIKIRIRKPIRFTGNHQNFGVDISSEDVVVLGNGPSLNESFNDADTYEFIKSKNIMVVNFFTEHPAFFDLKPSYICYMDPLFWEPNIAIESKRNRMLAIKQVLTKVDWDITVFMPLYAKQWNWVIDIPDINPHVKLIYVNTFCNYKNKKNLFKAYRENICMPEVQNVLIGALYIALQLKYKKIYLFGAENSWHLDMMVDDDNKVVFVNDPHCYDKGNDRQVSPHTIRALFEIFALVHKQYEILESYSKFLNAKIYNMSLRSYIDAFERFKLK